MTRCARAEDDGRDIFRKRQGWRGCTAASCKDKGKIKSVKVPSASDPLCTNTSTLLTLYLLHNNFHFLLYQLLPSAFLDAEQDFQLAQLDVRRHCLGARSIAQARDSRVGADDGADVFSWPRSSAKRRRPPD
jgi:hypothetical protein